MRFVSVDPPTLDPEIVRHDDGGFRVKERRDRSRRTKSVTLFFNKTIAVAGECLPQPKQVQVVFPLTPANP